jgi:hypothetical protein
MTQKLEATRRNSSPGQEKTSKRRRPSVQYSPGFAFAGVAASYFAIPNSTRRRINTGNLDDDRGNRDSILKHIDAKERGQQPASTAFLHPVNHATSSNQDHLHYNNALANADLLRQTQKLLFDQHRQMQKLILDQQKQMAARDERIMNTLVQTNSLLEALLSQSDSNW